MKIIAYNTKYKNAFIQFNTDWIIDNFGRLEKEDIETFEKIDEELENGAMIYFAVENDAPLATCMAKPMKEGTWEICKLASNISIGNIKGAAAPFLKRPCNGP